jgi:hypothetical protein
MPVRFQEMRRIVPLLALYLVGATYVAMSSGAADCGWRPVNVPIMPIGPDWPELGNTVAYRTFSTPAYGSQLRYVFYWGDESKCDTTDWYPNGDTASATKTWTSEGGFKVKALTMNDKGEVSAWSDGLTVHVYPKMVR